ncbi:BnaC06g02960D [Brassica napus]|uniref:BnaC06g02960D protein n=1 Tax=Brassica napus TaxID=3708 RepID=A0A078GNK7_BRANA|nr:BnaC06g02960D [Brassica napus]
MGWTSPKSNNPI